jgi:hypothetical protein
MTRLRILAALACSPLLLVAQEPVLFAQNFELRFQQWQINQSKSSTTQATYDFTFGLPVFTYRLGAMALTGSLVYDRATVHDETLQSRPTDLADAAFGLNSAGARFNLFPYRPFRVRFDYQRTKTPGLLGNLPIRGDIFGAGVAYRGHYVNDLDLSFRKSTLRQDQAKESWSTLDFNALQRFGATEVTLLAQRQEFEATAFIPAWRNTHAVMRTETVLSPTWRLRTTESIENFMGSRWMDGDATLQGFTGNWTNLTTLGFRSTSAGEYRSNSTSAGQSVSMKKGQWHLTGTAAFSKLGDSLGRDAQNGSLVATINTALGTGWNFVSSLAATSMSGSLLPSTGAKGSTSVQFGLVRGGELPDLVRHSLFLVSDWTFDRYRNEAYPPGYLPAELADQLVQRRLRQRGRLGFSMDLGRTSERGGSGTQDWARVSGDLTAGSNFRMMVLGDLRKDDSFTLPGVRTTNRAFTGNASYSLSRVSLTATLGLTRYEQEGGSTQDGQPAPGAHQGPGQGATRYEAAGLNVRLWKMPVGVLFTRLDPGIGPSTQAVSTHMDLDYRLISFRVTFDEGRQSDGLRTRRVMLTLRRFFDTVALW